jgi:hypothetical protein
MDSGSRTMHLLNAPSNGLLVCFVFVYNKFGGQFFKFRWILAWLFTSGSFCGIPQFFSFFLLPCPFCLNSFDTFSCWRKTSGKDQ